MLNQGILNRSMLSGTLGEVSVLNPQSEKKQKSIVADLLLTALIDAFSILVIFLLMQFSSTGEILFMGKGLELPKSTQGEMLDRTPIVKVDDGKIYLEDKEVTANDLTAQFLELRKKFQEIHPGEEYPAVVTIQADRRVKYELLNQIVVAASQAGLSDMKFATLLK